jgi:FeS assembly SUF system protein
MVDPQYERLKKRKLLPVLNSYGQDLGTFVLEDEGRKPEDQVDTETLREDLVLALKSVYDPEIPINIYDLGLVYDLAIDESFNVSVAMTLTAPGCPVAGPLVAQVHDRVRAVRGVRHVRTELVWEPPWTKDRLSEAAKLELGLMW